MRISIICGSIRPERQTIKVAKYLEKQLLQRGINVELLDLLKVPLPLLGNYNSEEETQNTAVIGSLLRSSDAILFVSPEYHGSFSGIIKNAIDHFWMEFHRKPIAVATASSGKMGGINASVQLQHVILSVGAYPLPLKFLCPEIQLSFDETNKPQNKTMMEASKKFLDELIWFANALISAKQKQIN